MRLKAQKKYCETCLMFKGDHDGTICIACIDNWCRAVDPGEPVYYQKKKKEDKSWATTS